MLPDSSFWLSKPPTQQTPSMKRPVIDLTGEEAQKDGGTKKQHIIMSHMQEMTRPCVEDMLKRCAERGCSKTHVYLCPVVICSKCDPEK